MRKMCTIMQAQQFKKALQRRLGVKIETDGHEDAIAMDIANPQSIDVTLKDIGGHQDTKKILVQPHQRGPSSSGNISTAYHSLMTIFCTS